MRYIAICMLLLKCADLYSGNALSSPSSPLDSRVLVSSLKTLRAMSSEQRNSHDITLSPEISDITRLSNDVVYLLPNNALYQELVARLEAFEKKEERRISLLERKMEDRQRCLQNMQASFDKALDNVLKTVDQTIVDKCIVTENALKEYFVRELQNKFRKLERFLLAHLDTKLKEQNILLVNKIYGHVTHELSYMNTDWLNIFKKIAQSQQALGSQILDLQREVVALRVQLDELNKRSLTPCQIPITARGPK